MAEENQVTKEPQGEAAQQPSGAHPVQQITKEPQRVTMKNPKKVEAGKMLAESNHKKTEVKKREEQVKLEASGTNQYYGIGAVLALGVIGTWSWLLHLLNQESRATTIKNPKPHPQTQPQTNKFEKD